MASKKDVRIELPDRFMRVKCTHKSAPNLSSPSMIYWFDPKDLTFRTRWGNNKTNRIAKWAPY